MENINQSPVQTPVKEQEQKLNFFEALKKVVIGRKITKLEWNNKNIYSILADGKVRIKLADGEFHDWIISDDDLLGEDFIVLE